MIYEMTVDDDLFVSPAQCIVNAVNCQGVMGAGLARAFKEKMPKKYFDTYKEFCRDGLMEVGRVSFWTENADDNDATLAPPHSIVCDFPTVGRLYKECKIEWIEEGLKSLRRDAETYKIQSIGIPAIGCGIVGHDWPTVHQMIIDAFEGSDIDVYIYPPREKHGTRSHS